jgi:hypothetical protein
VQTPVARRRFLAAYGVWLFVIAAYFIPGATWNPASRFALTRAIVEHHSLAIDGFEESTGDRSFRDGHWYTDKAPIPSLLAVPAYAIVHALGAEPSFEPIGEGQVRVSRGFRFSLWICSIATAGLSAALLGIFLFISVRAPPPGALVASSAAIVATPVFPYATSFYGHALAGLFLAVAVAVAALAEPSRRDVRIAGACLALAAGCEYLTAIPAVLIAGFVLIPHPRRALDLALGALAPGLIVAAYHTACFGAPWRTGYSFLVRPQFVAGHGGGFLGIHTPKLAAMAGLLVGPRRGLFFIAPIALAGVVGLVQGVRNGDRASRIALSVSALMLVLVSGYYMWWGGAAAGPRHLVPVLPLLAYGLATLWSIPRLRVPLGAVAIVSCGIVLALVAVGLEAPERGNVLFDYVWPNLSHGRLARIPGASNVGLLLGLPRLFSLVPLVVWMAGGFAWLARESRR